MDPIVNNRIKLTSEEVKRYARHLILPEVGTEGQERLKAAKILLVGTGGLGSPAALYLAAAGIGTLGMVDYDVVDFTNLQRQILHFTSDVSKSKLQSAQDKLTALNPGVHLIPHETRLCTANALDIIKDYDVVVDGTDNFPTRYLINDACAILKKANVYGSIYRFDGMASVFAPHVGGPCYRCWYPEPPPPDKVPSCAEAGVLGVLPGIIGIIQATEAIKLILDQGTSLIGRLLRYNALTMSFKEHRIPRDPACALCGANPTITQLQEITMTCAPNSDDITVEQLKAMFDRKEDFVLLDVRNPDEFVISEIKGSKKLPLPDLPAHVGELPKEKLIVLHCKMGGRSAKALQFLRSQGYTKLKNVAGGITAWAERIEPNLPA